MLTLSPVQWLPIDALMLTLALVAALLPIPRCLRVFNVLLALTWCFWIGWNLSQAGQGQ